MRVNPIYKNYIDNITLLLNYVNNKKRGKKNKILLK